LLRGGAQTSPIRRFRSADWVNLGQPVKGQSSFTYAVMRDISDHSSLAGQFAVYQIVGRGYAT